MDDLDIVLVNVISFMSGTLTGLFLGYKWSIGCISSPEQTPSISPPTGMSHSSSGTFQQGTPPPQEAVMASAPQPESLGKEIIIRTQ